MDKRQKIPPKARALILYPLSLQGYGFSATTLPFLPLRQRVDKTIDASDRASINL
jgi:hypothetical protein